MRRPATAVVLSAVLGAGCTGDRPPLEDDGTPAAVRPRCDVLPGAAVPGFFLTKTREVRYPDRIGLRKEYRDDAGRLLVYLLGISGEVGEGAGTSRDVRLSDGTSARLRGSGENWTLSWEDDPPCPQIAVVGNGFTEASFTQLLGRAGLVRADN